MAKTKQNRASEQRKLALDLLSVQSPLVPMPRLTSEAVLMAINASTEVKSTFIKRYHVAVLTAALCNVLAKQTSLPRDTRQLLQALADLAAPVGQRRTRRASGHL